MGLLQSVNPSHRPSKQEQSAGSDLGLFKPAGMLF